MHALFRIARVPTINSAIAVRTINKDLSITTSTTNPRGLQQNYRSSNEPTVNTRLQPKEQMLRTLRTAQWLRHASWFSVPPSSYATHKFVHLGTAYRPSAFSIWRRGLQLTPHPLQYPRSRRTFFVCNGTFEMKTERFESNREGTKALTLSAAGVIFAMLMWNLMMLLFY